MDHRLRIGETAVVRPRWWGTSWAVIWTGRCQDGTLCFAVQWSMGHNSAAYNVFLPDGEREFAVPPGRVRVVEASASEVAIRFDPKA